MCRDNPDERIRRFVGRGASTVRVAPVADSNHVDDVTIIMNRVEYAIVTDPEPPETGSPTKLSHASRPRFIYKLLDPAKNPATRGASSASSSLLAERAKTTAYSAIGPAPTIEPLLDRVQRLPRFVFTGLGERPVVEVFPKLRVLLEVDQDTGFPTFVVD